MLLAQQLPLLPKFSGEMKDGDMDTFQDWYEQFEMIASVCGWTAQAKLVNLVTRLRGQFFCTTQQKTSYVCWLRNYTRGLLQFTYKLCRVVYSMIRNNDLGSQ